MFVHHNMRLKERSHCTSPCAHLRAAYHECFNRWYREKFLKGQWDKDECGSEWEKYKACLTKHLEDKNLRRILEEDVAVYSHMDDSSYMDADGASESLVIDVGFFEILENQKIDAEQELTRRYCCAALQILGGALKLLEDRSRICTVSEDINCYCDAWWQIGDDKAVTVSFRVNASSFCIS
ncbi:hypothetical protein H6P81_004649 [Aristolochia fimbriata]|uniref:Uncharacterized protein n=1 Tax=Aristolochia fimbriata TaxID=158543 RepID=A0AAV7ES98_ARIFI|nr:hypothetical protein H6P81_004649 [Aristolochia fimbriata]